MNSKGKGSKGSRGKGNRGRNKHNKQKYNQRANGHSNNSGVYRGGGPFGDINYNTGAKEKEEKEQRERALQGEQDEFGCEKLVLMQHMKLVMNVSIED